MDELWLQFQLSFNNSITDGTANLFIFINHERTVINVFSQS